MKKILLLLVFSFSLFTLCEAQYIDLLSFNSTNGLTPNGSLTLSITRDTLYGLTVEGGAYNYGNIFCIKRDGTGYVDLLDFNGSNGAYPYGSLTLSKSGKELYGLTSYGGNSSFGDIFTINTDGSSFTDIFDFNGTEGAYPTGSLTASVTGDSLFGMTGYGGYGYGNIFYISPNGSNFSDMYDFSGSDGSEPFGSLTLVPNGKSLMGMTYNGGNSSYGNIFIISNSGSVFSSLYSFTDGLDGAFPYGDLVFSVTSDSVFGLCSGGGNSGYGSLFTISAGDGLTDLVDFGGAIGATPEGNVKVVGSTLYGMTSAGGAGGNGTVFSYRTSNNRYEDLLDFMGTIGSKPYCSLVYANKVLYGMTSQGGEFNYGIIFGDTVLTVSSISLVNVTCTSGNIGVADAIPVGGVTPYTYSWNPGGSTNESIRGLSLGSYTVTVADNRGSIATSVARITGITASASVNKNVSCYGADDGEAIASISGGSAPFNYSWSNGATITLIENLSAGTYTVTVSDMCDATATASVVITQPALIPSPSIVALKSDSVAFTVSNLDTTLYYSWSLADFGTTYSGSGDTAFLPVYPRLGTLTISATNTTTKCVASTSITISHNIDTTYHPPANLPYPRWSKRGVFLENCCSYIGLADSTETTSVVNYCLANHITYVLLDGTSWYGGSCAVFGQDSVYYDTAQARQLENFIDSLKTRGRVEQVGVMVYEDTMSHPWHDSNSLSVEIFNVQNRISSIYMHNLGLLWEKKIDYLSLDNEFWNDSNDLYLFHNWHMPVLKAMYEASRECHEGNLRVEDYIGEPLNKYNTSFNVNDSVELMMADSIAMYSDRILNSCYTKYQKVLWNRGDFVMAYSHFGSDSTKNMEIWPVFDAANFDNTSCTICWDAGDAEDYLGATMCALGVGPVYMEQQYFDSLSFCENQNPKIFTSNGNTYSKYPMGADTNFMILGDAWFQYSCVSDWTFDTNTFSGGLHYYVTLPHDIQWFYPSVMPDTMPSYLITATVHGGSAPYNYIWYDMDSNRVLQSSSSNTYTVTWSPHYTRRIRVLAVDGKDSTATDYMLIYEICTPPSLRKPVKPSSTAKNYSASSNINKVNVYPNPNIGSFTMELSGVSCQCIVEVYNELGEKVYTETLSQPQGKNIINLMEQSNGIYFYRVISETGRLIGNGKVIIEK